MAYINFKEERAVAKVQLDKRIKNNEKLFRKIRQNKTIPEMYSPDKKYSYKDFKNHTFGGGHMKGEVDFEEVSNKNIVCTTFNNCKFSNIKFKDCKFIGCYFIECNFDGGGVIFDNCILIKQDSEELPSLNRKDNFSCDFKGCNIYGKFINCSLNYAIFNKCNIKNTSFELTDMTSVIITNSELKMVIITDADLTGTKITGTYIEDLEFRDKKKTKMDEKTFVDKIQIKEGTRDEYEGLYMVYETLADKFKENNLNNNFGEYYYLCKNKQRKTLKPIPKIGSFLNWFTCGYGERPLYAVYSSLIIIIIFSILYLFTGIDINGHIVRYGFLNRNLNLFKILGDYNEALNLSVGMFAGVGFNNAQPMHTSYMVSNLEMLIGVVMMGIGIGTLTKKLVR